MIVLGGTVDNFALAGKLAYCDINQEMKFDSAEKIQKLFMIMIPMNNFCKRQILSMMKCVH